MKKRLGFVGIIIDPRDRNVGAVNEVLSAHGGMILGRMGIPHRERRCGAITLIIEATTDELGALTGRLGALPGVTVRSALAGG